MNNCLNLIRKKSQMSVILILLGFMLLTSSANASPDTSPGMSPGTSSNTAELQCDLVDNDLIKPAVITAMIEAANRGYLYRIDSTSSIVAFQVNHFPFSSVEGHFENFQGGVTLPLDAGQSRHALFVIKVDSVSTGDDELDGYLKSPVFFDATRFPEILFISTSFEWLDETTARLYGELTLRGMTRPIIFIAHIASTENYDKNNRLTMIANAEIQRSEFGMHDMQLLVSDTVRFSLKIEASRFGI